MKLNGFVGKGTGKLGSSVFAVSGGEQIVRQYNPNVSNPSTNAQVAQRAKLKLMSQIAADLASVIAIPKQGLKSSRNLFISKNISLCSYDNGEAACELSLLQITAGSTQLPSLGVTAGSGSIQAALETSAPAEIAKVVYVLCKKGQDTQIYVVDSKVVSEEGTPRTFNTTFTAGGGEYVVLAYGLKASAGDAGINYGNYYTESAEDIATLATLSRTRNGAGDFTVTQGAFVEIK